MKKTFEKYFSIIEDPRVQGRCTYPFDEMLLVAFSAIICGAKGYQDMEDFGETMLPVLKEIYPFEAGIPRHDTFRDLFLIIDDKQFESAFRMWCEETLVVKTQGDTIAVDGKCLKASHIKHKSPLYMVSAWCDANNLCIGQIATDSKSNEIKAIPQLLKLLNLKGRVVTLDAMGCQRAISSQIMDQKGDYICCLKGNQGTLHKDVKDFFEAHEERNYQDSILYCEQTTDKGHGRIETRKYSIINELDWGLEEHNWPGFKSVGKVESTRQIDGHLSQEVRYFITSLSTDIQRFAKSVRAHWGIENKMHWVLDNHFFEDNCRVRKGNGAKNLAILRRHAINRIRKRGDPKISFRRNMNRALLNNNHLRKILID